MHTEWCKTNIPNFNDQMMKKGLIIKQITADVFSKFKDAGCINNAIKEGKLN